MVSEVIIADEEKYERIKGEIKKAGMKNFHVIADFDKTLTKVLVNGKTIPSIISLLRDNNYISEEYSTKAKKLFAKYHPLEIDPSLSKEEKKKYMSSWWNEHFDLLIKSGLNKNHLEKIVESEGILLREGVLDFLDYLNKNKIPLVIFSSSGIGDAIPMMLEKYNKTSKNIFVVSNMYIWDKNGNAVGINQPIIHSMNKDETSLKEIKPVYEKIKDRKNVLLLGDSIGDIGMIEGFDYKNLLKVGFLNEEVEKNLNLYKENFDIVITNDGDFDFVNDLVGELK